MPYLTSRDYGSGTWEAPQGQSRPVRPGGGLGNAECGWGMYAHMGVWAPRRRGVIAVLLRLSYPAAAGSPRLCLDSPPGGPAAQPTPLGKKHAPSLSLPNAAPIVLRRPPCPSRWLKHNSVIPRVRFTTGEEVLVRPALYTSVLPGFGVAMRLQVGDGPGDGWEDGQGGG